MFVDAHIHLWRLDDGERFWMRDKIAALARDFTEDDLRELRARCGVGAAIAVQAMHNVAESERLLEELVRGPDFAEGAKALSEKRPPKF